MPPKRNAKGEFKKSGRKPGTKRKSGGAAEKRAYVLKKYPHLIQHYDAHIAAGGSFGSWLRGAVNTVGNAIKKGVNYVKDNYKPSEIAHFADKLGVPYADKAEKIAKAIGQGGAGTARVYGHNVPTYQAHVGYHTQPFNSVGGASLMGAGRRGIS